MEKCVMESVKSVNLGIIGCGCGARDFHWPALKKLPNNFRITALCNRSQEKAAIFARVIEEHRGVKVPYTLDYRELLLMKEVEAVAVLLPVEMTPLVSRLAAATGKHILLESPIAPDMNSARDLVKLDTQYPYQVFMVGETSRYRRIYSALATVLRSDHIGIPYYAEWKVWQQPDSIFEELFLSNRWRLNRNFEGGYVTTEGIHNIAVLRDIFGDLEPMASSKASVNPSAGDTDSLVCLFRTSGAGGIPPLSCVLNLGYSVHGLRENKLQVLGTRGSVVVEGTRMTIYGNDSSKPLSVGHYSDNGGFQEQYLDFHKAITTMEAPVSSIQKAYEDFCTLSAALEMGAVTPKTPAIR